MGKRERSLSGIIEGCKARHIQCEEQLYKQFYGYLRAVARRYMTDRTEIEEMLNDSFLRIFKKIGSFVYHGPEEQLSKVFKGWVGKITANTAIDRLRVKRRVLYIEEVTDEVALVSFEAPDNLTVEDILKLLDQLPAIQRIIFNMYEIDGFTHEEISVMLEIPASTSRVYLTRAKSRLQQLYLETMNVYDEQQRIS